MATPSDIQLPNVNTAEVHLLISQDHPDLLFPHETKKGKPGEPFAIWTALGWAINGPISCKESGRVSSHFIKSAHSIENDFHKLWELDNTCVDDHTSSVADKKVLSIWESSLQSIDNHYMMDIPFKTRPPNFPDSRYMAEQRLNHLSKRLQRDPETKEKYTDGIKQLVDKKYAEKVPDSEINKTRSVWYLPHHPVFSAKKPDKCRIVFDCAAKVHGASLNDFVT